MVQPSFARQFGPSLQSAFPEKVSKSVRCEKREVFRRFKQWFTVANAAFWRPSSYLTIILRGMQWDSTLRTLHSTIYRLISTFYTLHTELCTQHFSFYIILYFKFRHEILHSTFFHILHIDAFCILHFTFLTLHSTANCTLHTFHPTLCTPHSAFYIPHSTHGTSHSPLYSPHSTLHTLHSTFFTHHYALDTIQVAF